MGHTSPKTDFALNSFGLSTSTGAPPRLFPAGLRVERQPNEIAGLWYVHRLHQDSLPFGCPQCVSPMAIFRCISRHKFRQFVLLPVGAQDDAAVLVESQRQTVCFVEAGLSGNCLRNPDCQAVPLTGQLCRSDSSENPAIFL